MKNLPKKLATLCCAMPLMIFLNTGLQAQEDVKVELSKLTDTVYFLKGQGGNIGLSVGDDGVFMIDDQYAPMTDKIKAAVATLSDQPVKFILNTHWHGDHTGGNENFAKSGSVIVAHENVYKRLSTDQFMQAFNNEVKASPKMALPVVSFTEQINFHLNNDLIKVMHVKNAHTDGDAIIHFTQSNVIHMGDTFFNARYPFVDVSAGGSLKGVIAAAEYVLTLADDETQIIPGHGALASKADLQTYHTVLSDIHTQFQALKAAGKSDEDIMAEGITLDYDEDWGNNFIGPEKFIEILLSEPVTTVPVATVPVAKVIEPTNRDLHEQGAGQKAAHE